MTRPPLDARRSEQPDDGSRGRVSEEGQKGQRGEGSSPRGKPAQGGRPDGKPLTAERIRNIAEHYVGQRESSVQMLRAMLERRLMRRLRSLDPERAAEERAAAIPLIEAEVARLEGAGVVSDLRYAEMKARSALASGRGARRIVRDLGQKGVVAGAAQEALLGAARETAGGSGEGAEAAEVLRSAELGAAEVFVRKRRFGPYRTEPLPEAWAERSKIWRREASAMARAGFGVETIREVLDREPEE